jgi:cobalt transporter subunit CbtB
MQTSAVLSTASTRVRTVDLPWPALGVLMIGLVILYSVGLSNFTRAHNAAHDTRHATGFPCH